MKAANPKRDDTLEKEIEAFLSAGGEIKKEQPQAKTVDELKARVLKHQLDNPAM